MRFPIHRGNPQLSFICLWIVHVFHHPLIGVPPNINIYGSMALHSLRGIAAMPDVLWPAEAAPNASCRRFRRCLSTVEMGQWWPAAGPSLGKVDLTTNQGWHELKKRTWHPLPKASCGSSIEIDFRFACICLIVYVYYVDVIAKVSIWMPDTLKKCLGSWSSWFQPVRQT